MVRRVAGAALIAAVIEASGDVPGLQSVATAIATPCLRNRSIGGSTVSLSISQAPGNSTATTPAPAMAFTPASSECSTWSADRAP